MSDVVSIEELETELGLSDASLALHMFEYNLQRIAKGAHTSAPHRRCALRKHANNVWDFTFGVYELRMQFVSKNNKVGMWNVHDTSSLMFSGATPCEMDSCIRSLVSSIRTKWLSACARIGK